MLTDALMLEALDVLVVLELLGPEVEEGLKTTPNSAALVHGPRFPASVYAMIFTYRACASGNESVLKALVSAKTALDTTVVQVLPSVLLGKR